VKKSEWSDRELEELLRQMPKIQDHRDPHDIYQNLSLKKRKTKPWLLPGLAAVAALLLFFILVPKLDSSNPSVERADEQKSTVNKEMDLAQKDSTIALKKEDKTFAGKSQAELMRTESTKTAIYDEEVGNGTVLTYWIPDQQAQILIPISTLIPDSKGQSWLMLFQETMGKLKEEEWGLTNYYPLNVTMKLDKDNQTILVNVPKNHHYGQGSTNEVNFKNVITNDIASNSSSKKIKLTTNGEPGIDFGNYGRLEYLDVVSLEKHAYFFYYPEGSKIPLLTPSIETYNDIPTALEAMKTDPSEFGLQSSLVHLLPISNVSVTDKTLNVSFKGNTSMQDNQLVLTSFEALLLTAKQFGLENVIVKDAPLTNIGEFDLSKEINVPIAPNFRNIQ
jgi:hypothetical protein